MPTTQHLSAANPADVQKAASLLREGKLVAFATETVYGLGANALSADAVAKIFAAKQRPAWDPVIVHLATADSIGQVAEVPAELGARFEAITKAFWPGPLTLLLPRQSNVPDAVTAGRALVGVRVPQHAAARALLAAAGIPIAAPSANRFGHTSPTTASHVLADLDGRIDAVLDAGPTTVGVESTVLDPTQTPMVLYRPGAVTAEQLIAVTGIHVALYEPVENSKGPESLPSPGVGIRHYAPRARVLLTEGSEQGLRDGMVAAENRRAAVLLPAGWEAPPNILVQPWSRWDDAEALAASLFAALRAADEANVDAIFVPLPAVGGLNDAIRDRLKKAAMME